MTTFNIMRKKAIVTGVSGQMGRFVVKEFINNGYDVIGTTRYTTNYHEKIKNITDEIRGHLNTDRFDVDILNLEDQSSIDNIVKRYKPDCFLNCAAMSHVGESWKIPDATCDITGVGVLRCLEGIGKHAPECRFVQCSSSEMFGQNNNGSMISEDSKLKAKSPYGAAKILGHQMVGVYRESYGIHASSAIFFNYESMFRGSGFFTRKITKAMGEIYRGEADKIILGNLNFMRDWGYAGDYARAMYLMSQAAMGDDYVIATGKTYTGKEFINMAFAYANSVLNDVFFDFDKHISCDNDTFMRPNDLTYLCGNSSKANFILGWEPKYDIIDIIEEMVDYDVFQRGEV